MSTLLASPPFSLPAQGLRFVKMHGLGNDFMLVDTRHQLFRPEPGLVRQLADRRRGVGFDQLMLLHEPSGDADAAYRIYNADGGEAEQCGNGARCVARMVYESGRSGRRDLVLESPAGVLRAVVREDWQVSLEMGVPDFRPAALPFEATSEAEAYTIQLDGESLRFGAVSMGNPHVVLPVESVATAPVGRLGPALETHPRFPRRTNVGFMEVVDRGHLRVRVWERGTGETLACGTGACAAAAVARSWGRTGEETVVSLPGGDLTIAWPGTGHAMWMTGPTVKVYEGIIGS